MKKYLFAGFGFLFCGVALAGVSKALTVEVNPCFRSNSLSCQYNNSYRTSGCRYSRCLNSSYSRTNYRQTTVRYNTSTTTPIYRNSYVRNYRTTYRQPNPYQTYRTSYVRPTTTTTRATGCIKPTCTTSTYQQATPTYRPRTTTYTARNTGCVKPRCTTTTYQQTTPTYQSTYDSYNQTVDAQITSTYEGNYTYLITPVNTYDTTWSWNYNSKSVSCDVVQGNSLRCVKHGDIPPSEITADFTVNGHDYTSNIINL